jgi:TonB family protein
MKYKILTVMLLILMLAVVSSAQTSYKGLTPGKSRKVEVERVLGQPVKQLSETLVEYRPQPLAGRIYVQYRADSGVVERIEFICRLADSNCADFMKSLTLNLPNAEKATPTDDKGRYLAFSEPPHYVVETMDQSGEKENNVFVPVRVAFYSRELYEAEVVKAKQVSQAETGASVEQPTQGARGEVRLSEDEAEKLVIQAPQPSYPPMAKAVRVSGSVKVEALVSEQGLVVSAKALSGHPLLQGAATDAVRRRKYKAHTVDGKQVSFITIVEVLFPPGS